MHPGPLQDLKIQQKKRADQPDGLSVYPKSHTNGPYAPWKSTQNLRISSPFPAAPRHRPPGAEARRAHLPAVPQQRQAAPVRGPPDARRAVRRGAHQQRGVAAEGHGVDGGGVAQTASWTKWREMVRKPLEKWEIRGKWPGRMWLDTASFGTGGNLGNLTILNGENH